MTLRFYKPNTAFYEAYNKRLDVFAKTIQYINENHPEIFTIADAKRRYWQYFIYVCFSDLKF
jgi:hypothetical protein